jgi:hypothetical protein
LEKARQFGIASTAASLGYVGRNRDAGAPNLARQAITLFGGKDGGSGVDIYHQPMSLMPNLELPEILQISFLSSCPIAVYDSELVSDG